jgi:hypothetical protein
MAPSSEPAIVKPELILRRFPLVRLLGQPKDNYQGVDLQLDF